MVHTIRIADIEILREANVTFIRDLKRQFNDIRMKRFKNKHQKSRAFIIGNGPSLRADDLNKLINEITFTSNKIYLIFDRTDWRPTYYCVEDSLVAQQNIKEINEIQGPRKLFPKRFREWLPDRIPGAVYFNLLWTDFYPGKPKFSKEAFPTFYWGSTVTYTHMQLAAYMGITTVYLLGVDFYFKLPPGFSINDKILVSSGEANHFHPDYRKKGEEWHAPNLAVQLQSYTAAKEFTHGNDLRIFNASRQTHLTIFETVDFDSLF